MPGYLAHFACCKQKTLENVSFLRGVEAPDLLKKHFIHYGLTQARQKYEKLRTVDMPDYARLEARIKQKECMTGTDGLHYGISSKPGVWDFWNSLSKEEKQNPFYRGYEWHLLTDSKMYGCLDIDTKFQKVLRSYKNAPNLEELERIEVEKLHTDWDGINEKIRQIYPDVIFPREIQELNVVKFIEKDSLDYVDWEILKQTINFLRTFNPLAENMEEIIWEIMA